MCDTKPLTLTEAARNLDVYLRVTQPKTVEVQRDLLEYLLRTRATLKEVLAWAKDADSLLHLQRVGEPKYYRTATTLVKAQEALDAANA